MGNTGPGIASIIVGLLVVGQLCLLVLESAVSIIQGYVFSFFFLQLEFPKLR
jgi:hypothetical protein